jgi:hypothetical protein
LHAGEGTGNGDFERRFVSAEGVNPWYDAPHHLSLSASIVSCASCVLCVVRG